ncbi:MAG: CPBP family intramembrane metalloprotease [Myxococcales bacterium]|nr:CPBP family intramembrane metalloprotease [Myxococcales bacterium]
MLPAWSPTLLILAALGFAIVNAALEELLFRGLVQGALERLLGPGWAALLLQAALFGVAHWGGFPSGPLGVLMAGSWALLLGWARRRGGGLLTPTLAHVVADLVIFASLAWAS